MSNKARFDRKSFGRVLLALVFILALAFGDASQALAARSGGRIGGGSFRSPSRTYSAPSGGGGGYRSPAGGGYGGYGGGGFGFPFLIPFFFGGGGFGGLFTILIFITIANFLVKSFRGAGVGGGDSEYGYSPSTISVGEVQVGLLANARDLKKELDDLAYKADTGTAPGRALVLQEATLALLRHPEYWVYGAAESYQAGVDSAEAKFNQLALAERSKFIGETLSNVNSQLKQASQPTLPEGGGELAQLPDSSGDYIVVTVLVGAEGKLKLPKINDSADIRQALQDIGGIGSDRLLVVEILWTPQAEGDVLTSDDILANYPNLKLI
jgi:uncharacterized membrane protein